MIRTSLRRPVAVAMTYTAVALLGVAAWRNIPVEELPDTQHPQLTIQASWPGSSPETVEAFLTAPIEAAVQQVRGVEKIFSWSMENVANVQVEFGRDVDMDFARLDLSERLASIEESLPAAARRVSVLPYVPEDFAEQYRPILEYTFTGPYTLEALMEHLEDVVVPDLSRIEGVAVVEAEGGRRRLLDVRLEEEEIAALGLTPFQVRGAIEGLDMVQEAGAIRRADDQLVLTIVNRAASADEVRGAVITSVGGTLVRLGDVATVHDTYEEARSYRRINRRPAVTFGVHKEIGSNTVRVADAVKARVEELGARSPYGTRFILDRDQSETIKAQLTDLRTRAIFSALVIFVVLLAFLRSFRSAALIFATIAFSVLIALNLVYFGGLTLNLLTLMGLALGFGLIVDNSIVVLENVYRRWQRGEDPAAAAEHGAREVALPILASTATTLIVLVPFVYLRGELRVYYVPLAIVVALTLLASLFVAFTFIPSLSARILALGGRYGSRRPQVRERPPLYIRFYRELVSFNVRRPWLAFVVTAVAFGSSYYLFDRYVGRWTRFGYYGSQDPRIEIRITLPRGSNLERMDQLVQYFEERLAAMPEPEQFISEVGETSANINVTFPDSIENTQVPVAIKEQMVAFSHTFTGADVRVYGYGPSFYGGSGGAPNYGIQVLGYNYLMVRDIAEDIGRRLSRLSRVVDVDTNSSTGSRYNRDRATEFVLRVNRDRLTQFGLTVQDLTRGVSAAIQGASSRGQIKLGGEEVEFDVKLEENVDMDVIQLRETLIDTPDRRRIRLGDVVNVESREVLSRIQRENQQYERTVAYEFRGPQRLGDLYHERVIEATEVPPGYTVQESNRYLYVSREERQQIWLVIAIALVLVYMVTAALFESLLQPLSVMLTVPMALIGVYLIFFYTNAAFTLEAFIGVIMMFGIVVNNAILLVDHVNGIRAREPELDLEEAVVKGTLERVRPILMTTTTTVLGLLPLVLFGEGAGTNVWDALALVLIGGLLSSTLFVLTITPAAYHVLESLSLGRRGAERPGGDAVGTHPVHTR